jgi:hypothetical protein
LLAELRKDCLVQVNIYGSRVTPFQDCTYMRGSCTCLFKIASDAYGKEIVAVNSKVLTASYWKVPKPIALNVAR